MLNTFISISKIPIVLFHSDHVFGLIAKAVNGFGQVCKFDSISTMASFNWVKTNQTSPTNFWARAKYWEYLPANCFGIKIIWDWQAALEKEI